MHIPAEFDEIRPVADKDIRANFEALLHDRMFMKVLKGFVPWAPKGLVRGFLRLTSVGVKSALGFQKRYMLLAMNILISRTTKRLTFDADVLPRQAGFTYLSNHRDIVLDAAMLDVLLIKAGFPNTVQIAIGDNLLVYPWIERFVRMNKCFIVRRSLAKKDKLEASKQMSRYMHLVIDSKDDNIWIAQRNGRAKDSDDRTMPSLIRMLASGSDLPAVEAIKAMHIVPLTISYEYDPCDYLKAKEFQQKRDNPNHQKSKQDDLDNMKEGIMGKKGRVHYACAEPIDQWLDTVAHLPEHELFEAVATHLDREIHKGYRLYATNYVAADLLENGQRFASHYSADEQREFEAYLRRRIAKVDLPNPDEAYLRQCILTMYANPLYNHLKAIGKDV
ncbi:MAG: 1-acyl-sn-glycerol-3-phosphate acyltransferase [Bacteroidaceae bacterium]|nr:1-acyl-sn-glycerol-3-phosphate acyltransferase [Bacteroidaceae bacterium]